MFWLGAISGFLFASGLALVGIAYVYISEAFVGVDGR